MERPLRIARTYAGTRRKTALPPAPAYLDEMPPQQRAYYAAIEAKTRELQRTNFAAVKAALQAFYDIPEEDQHEIGRALHYLTDPETAAPQKVT